jgi:hypothetical protein
LKRLAGVMLAAALLAPDARAQAPAAGAAGSDSTGARPGMPGLGAVKDVVKDSMKDALKAAVAPKSATATAPASAAAPPVPASDPLARAAALRRKNLKDDDFIDSDSGNRDPFKSFLRFFVDKPMKVRTVPAVFEKYTLEELSLIAIVSGDANPRAMFRDPAGLGQTVKRGDYLSKAGARVTKILSDRVILEMNEPSVGGDARAVEKAVLVRPEEEAAK